MSNQDTTIDPPAQDSIPGATSGDVNKGLGKPIEGQSSAELHHDGQSHRKRQREGLVGLAEPNNQDAVEIAKALGKKVPGDH